MEKKMSKDNEKEEGENETLSREERKPSTHTHGLYIESRRCGK
jgi:hypothetical protein